MNPSPTASSARSSGRSHSGASLAWGKASAGNMASFGGRGLSGTRRASISASRQREQSASSQPAGTAVAGGHATYNYALERSKWRVSPPARPPAAQVGR